MNKIIKLIILLFVSAVIQTVYADDQRHQYSQKTYDALLMRAQKYKDNEAMFTLSTMYCDDSSYKGDCYIEALKWLKTAANNGNKKAQTYLQQKNSAPFGNDHGVIIFLADEIKNGDYTIRFYEDSLADCGAYFEIYKNNKLIFAPSSSKGATRYIAKLFTKGLFGDDIPTLQMWLSNGGTAAEVDTRYFSLGKELKCLIDNNSHKPYWNFHRFDEEYSNEAVDAFKTGKAQLTECTAPDNLITSKNNND